MTREVFGPYRLVALLGRGGMGEVWRAIDTGHDDRVVAIKLLQAAFADHEEFVRQFRRECSLAAKLTGPHIIGIHSYGEIDGRLFIEMPLVNGVDLGTLLERDGPMPPERAVGIVDQVADALDTAHDAGLVHRDVKPSNVLIARRDFAYLIDFGIARAVDGSRLSRSGTLLGTYAYMAPERFDGRGDHRSDVYALGCVLHETLTGRPPFTAESPLALMRAHDSAPPPRPSAARPGLPAGLDEVVTRSLAKDPADRFPSAGGLAMAARDALQTQPVRSRSDARTRMDASSDRMVADPSSSRPAARPGPAAAGDLGRRDGDLPTADALGGEGHVAATTGPGKSARPPGVAEPPAVPVTAPVVRARSSYRVTDRTVRPPPALKPPGPDGPVASPRSGRRRRRMPWLVGALAILTVVALVAATLIARTRDAGSGGQGGAGGDKLASISAVAGWDEDVAATYMWKELLEQRGYKVNVQELDISSTFTGVANGQNDLYLDAWLPSTHAAYWNRYKDKLEVVSDWSVGRNALTVPAYVDVNSIADVKAKSAEFGGRIVGIEAGAGEMKTMRERVIPAYGLDNLVLVEGSSPAMLATLDSAIKQNQPVVVTLWQPHWAFSRYQLKVLEDPMGALGPPDQLQGIATKGWSASHPELAGWLKNFKMTSDQLAGLMLEIQQAGKGNEQQAAKQWISENQAVVNGWFTGASS